MFAASKDSSEGFEVFYRENYRAVLAFVRSRVSGDSEALVAEVFTTAWLHFRRTGELNRAWLFGVARNKVGDHYRSAPRRREVLTEDFAAFPVDDQTERSADRIAIRRALRTLPKAYREVLVLIYWCRLTDAEAADVLEISGGALRMRAHRARRALVRALGESPARAAVVTQEENLWTI